MDKDTKDFLVMMGKTYNRLAWWRNINPFAYGCESERMYTIRKIIQNYLEVEKS